MVCTRPACTPAWYHAVSRSASASSPSACGSGLISKHKNTGLLFELIGEQVALGARYELGETQVGSNAHTHTCRSDSAIVTTAFGALGVLTAPFLVGPGIGALLAALPAFVRGCWPAACSADDDSLAAPIDDAAKTCSRYCSRCDGSKPDAAYHAYHCVRHDSNESASDDDDAAPSAADKVDG